MTREEAIEVIKQDIPCEHDTDLIEALEMAIKALEQEPDAIHNEREQAYMKGYEDASKRYRTEPCGDVISRAEAIRIASGYCHRSNIPKELAKLPSVNPIPCEDAISRQAVLNILDDMVKDYVKENDFDKAQGVAWVKVQKLPSVITEKTGRWIPVSEKLPEEDGQYLITVKYVHVDGYDDIYAEHGEWTDGKWDTFCFGHCGQVETILAWMPLPQPYKEESEV